MNAVPGKSIHLDIVSDVVCPWCFIGYRRLERAMQELEGRISFQIQWRPFELNPHMGPDGEEVMEHLMRKYGQTRKAISASRERIVAIGADLGIDLGGRYERRIYNTFAAHQALHWAREEGRETEFNLALFHEYFEKGNNPSDPQVLSRVAVSLAMDGGRVYEIVAAGLYAEAVRAEQQHYLALGIHSVPAFIGGGKFLISGAQEPAVLVAALQKLAA